MFDSGRLTNKIITTLEGNSILKLAWIINLAKDVSVMNNIILMILKAVFRKAVVWSHLESLS